MTDEQMEIVEWFMDPETEYLSLTRMERDILRTHIREQDEEIERLREQIAAFKDEKIDRLRDDVEKMHSERSEP